MTNTVSVYTKPDGRLERREPIGRDEKGRLIYKSFYGRTPEEALKKRDAYLEKLKKNSVVTTDNPSDLSFSQLAQEWLSAKSFSLKESSYSNYKMKLDTHILPFFKDLNVSEVTPAMVIKFLNSKKAENLSAGYIYDIMSVLKSIYCFAEKIYSIKNVFDSVKMPKYRKSEVSVLSSDEIAKLIKSVSPQKDRRGLAVLLAIYLGLRIGEICGLKWSDVDFVKNVICINRTVERIRAKDTKDGEKKTKIVIGDPKSEKSKRSVPINKEIIELLKAFKSEDDEYIISGKKRPLEPRNIQYYFKNVLEKSGLSHVRFHALRHAFATKALESGCDIKTLSEIMGHCDVQVTMRVYVHSSEERKRACMDMIKWVA